MLTPTPLPGGPTALQTPREEKVNVVTHGVATVLSLIGTIFLMAAAVDRGAGAVAACFVYGVSLVGLFATSTFYHACPATPLKKVARTLDHCAILVLIAGTYTPLMVLGLADWRGWTVLATIWLCAVLGIRHKLTASNPYGAGAVALCLLMGWLVVMVWSPLVASVGTTAIAWLVAGGVTYSLGVPFYAWNSLPYNHGIWHLFVIGGAVCHYASILHIL